MAWYGNNITFDNVNPFSDVSVNITDDAIIDGGSLTLVRLAGTFPADGVNLIIGDQLAVRGDGELRIQDGASVNADDLRLGGATGGGTFAGTFGDDPIQYLAIGEISTVGSLKSTK